MKKTLIILISFFLINNFALAAGGDSGGSSSKASMYDEAVKLIKRAGKLEKKDKGMNIMPLFHIHGLIASLLSSIVTGSSLVCTSGFNALTFYGSLKNFNPTWITAVPTMYQAVSYTHLTLPTSDLV